MIRSTRLRLRHACVGAAFTGLAACADATGAVSPDASVASLPGARTPASVLLGVLPLPANEITSVTIRESNALAVNRSGTVVGWSDRAYRTEPLRTTCNARAAIAWRGTPRVPVDLVGDFLRPVGPDLLCTYSATALDVNDAESIVGTYKVGTYTEAFLWTAAGGPRVLARLPGFRTTPFQVAMAINTTGVIVGFSNASSGATQHHAVKWTSPTTIVDIHPAGSLWSEAWDINDAGDIVGMVCPVSRTLCYIAVWRAGVVTITGMRPGLAASAGVPLVTLRNASIINSGEVYGTRLPYGTLPGPGTVPFGISSTGTESEHVGDPRMIFGANNRQRVVGSSVLRGLERAYTRDKNGTTLLDLPSTAYSISRGIGINLCGAVAGIVITPTRFARAIVWPAPPGC